MGLVSRRPVARLLASDWRSIRKRYGQRTSDDNAWPISSVSPNAWLSAQPVTTFPQNSTQIRLAHSSSWTPRAAVGIGSCCCCSSRAPIRCAVVYANLPRKSCSTHICFVNDAIYTWFLRNSRSRQAETTQPCLERLASLSHPPRRYCRKTTLGASRAVQANERQRIPQRFKESVYTSDYD